MAHTDNLVEHIAIRFGHNASYSSEMYIKISHLVIQVCHMDLQSLDGTVEEICHKKAKGIPSA